MNRSLVFVLFLGSLVLPGALGCGKKVVEPTCPGLIATVTARVAGVGWTSTIGGASGEGGGLMVEGEIHDAQGNVLSDLSFILVDVSGPGTYALTPGPLNVPNGSFCDSRRPGGSVDSDGDCDSPFYETDDSATGTVTIQTFNSATRECSGTFSFMARNLEDDSVIAITEGTFVVRCR